MSTLSIIQSKTRAFYNSDEAIENLNFTDAVSGFAWVNAVKRSKDQYSEDLLEIFGFDEDGMQKLYISYQMHIRRNHIEFISYQ